MSRHRVAFWFNLREETEMSPRLIAADNLVHLWIKSGPRASAVRQVLMQGMRSRSYELFVTVDRETISTQ